MSLVSLDTVSQCHLLQIECSIGQDKVSSLRTGVQTSQALADPNLPAKGNDNLFALADVNILRPLGALKHFAEVTVS